MRNVGMFYNSFVFENILTVQVVFFLLIAQFDRVDPDNGHGKESLHLHCSKLNKDAFSVSCFPL